MKNNITFLGISNTATYHPCLNGHNYCWSGSPDIEIPEGTLCACGQTKVKYTICKECSQKRMEFVPVYEHPELVGDLEKH